MRKYIISSVVVIFILLFSLLVYRIATKTREARILNEKITTLPSFSFTDLNGSLFNSDTITRGPVLIVKFHPECEHCQYEISEILKSKIQQSGILVLLISDADRNMVIRFLDQFNIAEKNKVIPMLDTAFSFHKIFGKDIVPSNYIYNKELKLVKAIHGECRIETILNYLNIR